MPLLAATAAALERSGLPPQRWLVAARSDGPREQRAARVRAGPGRACAERFELRYNVPFAEMKGIMDASRVGFVLYPGDVNYGARIPIRIFEYMARGLPFVASDLATTAHYTRRARSRGAGPGRRSAGVRPTRSPRCCATRSASAR